MRARRLLAACLLAACSRSPLPASDSNARCEPAELQLERALPIAGELEPSGLLLDDGKLLMVADKHDDALFELRLGEQTATAEVFLDLKGTTPGPLDLEGLTRDGDGDWLLASEAYGRVLRVTSDGATSWATAPLEPFGAAEGLFAKPGAGLEGITRLPGGGLLLAAEREPRGLLESDAERAHFRARAMPRSRCPAPRSRPNDWADLTVWRGRVFALARNSHLVVELLKQAGAWQEARAWSYAKTENEPRFAYEDRRFGLGEGLAMDDRHVYVVLDNNRTARAAAPQDRRALLFVFQRPD